MAVKLVRVRSIKRPVEEQDQEQEQQDQEEEEAESLFAAAASFKYSQVPPTFSQKALSARAAAAPPTAGTEAVAACSRLGAGAGRPGGGVCRCGEGAGLGGPSLPPFTSPV